MKEGTLKGIAIGIGVTAGAIWAKTAGAGGSARPLLRAAVKSGILAVEKGRELLAEATENVEDIVAEVQDELRAEKMKATEKASESTPNQPESE